MANEGNQDNELSRRDLLIKAGKIVGGVAVAGTGAVKAVEMIAGNKPVEASSLERIVEQNMEFPIYLGGVLVRSNVRSEPRMENGKVVSASGKHKDYLVINPEMVDGDPYKQKTGKEPWIKFKGWLGRDNYAAFGASENKIHGEEKKISRLKTESGEVRYENNGQVLEVGKVIELPDDQKEREKIFKTYGLNFK